MSNAENAETRDVTILLAEDDAGHTSLITKNLRRANIANQIVTFSDGQALLDHLYEKVRTAVKSPPPVVVLLDLSMPVLDGYQVLSRLKADERTRSIPIVVLTTTDDPREVDRCYELGCNVYVTKPVNYERFCEAIRKLGLFLSVVTIPQRSKAS